MFAGFLPTLFTTIHNSLDDAKIFLKQFPQVFFKIAFKKCRNFPKKTSKMKFVFINN